jgi:hypothetical protein
VSELYDCINEWADHAESEIRLHCGMPNEGRREANAIVHNAILNCIDELLRRDDWRELLEDRRKQREADAKADEARADAFPEDEE